MRMLNIVLYLLFAQEVVTFETKKCNVMLCFKSFYTNIMWIQCQHFRNVSECVRTYILDNPTCAINHIRYAAYRLEAKNKYLKASCGNISSGTVTCDIMPSFAFCLGLSVLFTFLTYIK